MAVTYQTEGVKMPDIKKRETTEWIKSVAATYGKKVGEIAYIFCSCIVLINQREKRVRQSHRAKVLPDLPTSSPFR